MSDDQYSTGDDIYTGKLRFLGKTLQQEIQHTITYLYNGDTHEEFIWRNVPIEITKTEHIWPENIAFKWYSIDEDGSGWFYITKPIGYDSEGGGWAADFSVGHLRGMTAMKDEINKPKTTLTASESKASLIERIT